MLSLIPPHLEDPNEYAAWLFTALLALLGFRYIKAIIAFVLEALYQFFIVKNSVA